MIQITYNLSDSLANRLEVHFAESEESVWVLTERRDITKKVQAEPNYLSGYFETEIEAIKHWKGLRSVFTELPENPQIGYLEDRDWKEAYKAHYKPWIFNGIHWIPEWCKDNYVVPDNENAIYLDPGMAFGMYDHPSTRLCILSIVRLGEKWSDQIANKMVIDAGCGSGILALSAAKLGFGKIYAFDHDPTAFMVSCKNRDKNGLNEKILIELAELKTAISYRTADLILANILSGILHDCAKLLLAAINPCGYLVLSGMFEDELNELKDWYQRSANQMGKPIEMKVNRMNNWFSLRIKSLQHSYSSGMLPLGK